jgi:NitT/TauT family transport system permease protein
MAVVSHDERRSGPVPGFLGWIVAIVLLGLLFAVWAIYANRPGSQLLVPAPSDVFRAFVDLFGDAAVWRATRATLVAWLIAIVIAGVFGVAIGVAIGAAAGRGLGAVASPSLFVFAAFPIPAIVMLLVVWYGVSSPYARIAGGAMLAFFPIVTIAAYGQHAPDRASRTKALFRALEIGAVLALTGIVLVEILLGQNQIGHLLMERFTQLDTKGQFALAFWLWGLGLLLASPFAIGRWLAGKAS